MTTKRLLLNVFGVIAMVFAIYFGGNYLSGLADKSYKKSIDKHGIVIPATVTMKKYLKGRYVVFAYEYKGIKYSNKEQNREYYGVAEIGDRIIIKIDTTNPEDSYIIASE